jgi:hypothetical protein
MEKNDWHAVRLSVFSVRDLSATVDWSHVRLLLGHVCFAMSLIDS